MPERAQLTVRDVTARTGINPITLRSWIHAAVIPRGSGRARGTRYTETHVLKILAAQSLRAKGLGLEQVAYRIRRMTDEELASFVRLPVATTPASASSSGGAEAPSQSTAAPAASAASTSAVANSSATEAAGAYAFRPLQWVPLLPGITLLVDPDAGELVQRIAREIASHYAVRPDASAPPK